MAKKFLLVTHCPPYPANAGGKQRVDGIYRALREFGQTDLVLLKTDWVMRETSESERTFIKENYRELNADDWSSCPEQTVERPFAKDRPPECLAGKLLARVGAFFCPRAVNPFPLDVNAGRFPELLRRYDAAVFIHLESFLRAGAPTGPHVIVDVDDYAPEEARHKARRLSGEARSGLITAARTTEALYRHALRRAGHVWVTNPDHRRVRALASASVVPNVPHHRPQQTDKSPVPSDQVVGYVGVLDREMVEDGLVWFGEKVWPLVKKSCPDAVWRVAGRPDPAPAWLQDLAAHTSGLELVGFADDLGSFYRSLLLAVNPVFYGSGSNVKVIEALAYGVPIVGTIFGARGFDRDFRQRRALVACRSAAAMARAVVEWLRHPKAAAEAGRAGAELAAKHYSPEAFRDCVRGGVDAVLQRGGRTP